MNPNTIDLISKILPGIGTILIAITGIIWGREYRTAKNATIERLNQEIKNRENRITDCEKEKSFIERINSGENVEKLMKQHKKKENESEDKISYLEKNNTELLNSLSETQKALWLLLKGRIIFSFENPENARRIFRSLLMAFDYLIEENLDYITAYQTLKPEGPGVNKLAWRAIIKAGFFVETKEGDYYLTTEGKSIFEYYKKYKSQLNLL